MNKIIALGYMLGSDLSVKATGNLETKGYYTGEKPFKCKGKHRYTLIETIEEEKENGTIIKEVWACECGRKL